MEIYVNFMEKLRTFELDEEKFAEKKATIVTSKAIEKRPILGKPTRANGWTGAGLKKALVTLDKAYTDNEWGVVLDIAQQLVESKVGPASSIGRFALAIAFTETSFALCIEKATEGIQQDPAE